MTIHVLKTDVGPWTDVDLGKKPFEYRADDRKPGFERGDIVVLVCNGPGPNFGKKLVRRIGYVLRGNYVPAGFCVFELAPMQNGDSHRAEVATGEARVSS